MINKIFICLVVFFFLITPSVFALTAFNGTDVNFYYMDGPAETVNTKYQRWNTTSDTITGEGTTNDTALTGVGGNVVSCDIPNRNQTIILTSDSNSDAMVQVHNGTGTFGNNVSLTLNLYDNLALGVACTVEELSGKGVIAYTHSNTTELQNVTIWNGTNYETKSTIVAGYKQLFLTSRRGSNEIAIYGDTEDERITVAVWNSSSNTLFDPVNLTDVDEAENWTNTDNVINKTFDCSYETISGRLLCFYGNISNPGQLHVFIRNATDAAVNPQAKEFLVFNVTTANISKTINFVHTVANPTSNEILVFVTSARISTNINLSILVWNGSTLGNFRQGESELYPAISKIGEINRPNYNRVGAVYHYFTDNRTETEALGCWPNLNDDGVPNCAKWNGTTYSGKINAQNVTGGAVDVVSADLSYSLNDRAGLGGYWAFLATEDATADLNIQAFNGSTWGNLNEIETNLSTGSIASKNIWVRYDNSTPVFRSLGTNDPDNTILPFNSIQLNATIRDNFQLDCAWIQTNETGSFTNYTDGLRIACNYNSSSFWQYAEFSWSNNSISNSIIAYSLCANDTNGNRACSNSLTFAVAQVNVTSLLRSENFTLALATSEAGGNLSSVSFKADVGVYSTAGTANASSQKVCLGFLCIDFGPKSEVVTVTFVLEANLSGVANDTILIDNNTVPGLYKKNSITRYFACIEDSSLGSTPIIGVVYLGSSNFNYIRVNQNNTNASFSIRLVQEEPGNKFVIPVTQQGCNVVRNRLPLSVPSILTLPFVAFTDALDVVELIIKSPIDIVGDFERTGVFSLVLERNDTQIIGEGI